MSREAGTPHRTLTAAVLLGFLLGLASAHPLPSGRTNATLLEKRWESLFSRSVLGISGEKPELSWESDYLLGIKRVRRLYCNVGIGFHLQVLPDGRITGVHQENQYSEFRADRTARARARSCGASACPHLTRQFTVFRGKISPIRSESPSAPPPSPL